MRGKIQKAAGFKSREIFYEKVTKGRDLQKSGKGVKEEAQTKNPRERELVSALEEKGGKESRKRNRQLVATRGGGFRGVFGASNCGKEV